MSDNRSIILNEGGREKNSVEPKTKIFHDIKCYFNSTFKEVQKETKRLAKRINTENTPT